MRSSKHPLSRNRRDDWVSWRKHGNSAAWYVRDMARLQADVKTPYPRLRFLVEHGTDEERRTALHYVGVLGFSNATNLIVRILETAISEKGKDRYGHIWNCCWTLAWLDTDRSHQILLDYAFGEGDVVLRSKAFESMGFQKTHRVTKEAIHVMRHSTEVEMRWAAVWVACEQCVYIGFKPFEKAVLERLNDISPRIRGVALEVLLRYGSRRHLAAVAEHFEDDADSWFGKTVGDWARDVYAKMLQRLDV